jgi:hypothetical protein
MNGFSRSSSTEFPVSVSNAGFTYMSWPAMSYAKITSDVLLAISRRFRSICRLACDERRSAWITQLTNIPSSTNSPSRRSYPRLFPKSVPRGSMNM